MPLNSIASFLFLFRLRQGGALKSRTDHDIVISVGGRSTCAILSRPSSCVAAYLTAFSIHAVSYPARLRALFWIALTNFVLPVIFNIVLLVLVHNETFGNIVTVIAVISVNVYVQIVSGLLATLWCHSVGPYREPSTRMTLQENKAPIAELSTLMFAPPSSLGGTSNTHVETEATRTNASAGGEELQ